MIRTPAFKRFIALCLVVIVVYTLPVSLSTRLREVTIRLIRPVGSSLIKHNANLYNFYNNLKQISELRNQNITLEKEVAGLQQQLSQQADIKEENTALLKEVGVTGVTITTKKVFAQVVVTGNDPLDRTLTVDAGSVDGVQVGQPAVVQGALVGTVIQTSTHTSVIRAITSDKSNIQAWIISNHQEGFLSGTGTGLILSQITQGISVPNASGVETSGLGGSLPQGILIGQTSGTLSQPSDLSESFSITPTQDPDTIQSLFILTTS